MTNLFKRMIARTEYEGTLHILILEYSFIIHMNRAIPGSESMRELIEVSGIRDYESLKKIVLMDPELLKKPIKILFTRR